MVETPEFAPDGKQLLFATALNGWVQICISNLDGGNFRRISNVRAIEVSPKVNPKTGTDMLFISGRGGRQQLWHMNLDGTDMQQFTPGRATSRTPRGVPVDSKSPSPGRAARARQFQYFRDGCGRPQTGAADAGPAQ